MTFLGFISFFVVTNSSNAKDFTNQNADSNLVLLDDTTVNTGGANENRNSDALDRKIPKQTPKIIPDPDLLRACGWYYYLNYHRCPGSESYDGGAGTHPKE